MALWRPSYVVDGVKHQSRHWWFEYRIDGRRFRVNLKKTDKRTAQLAANELLAAIERGEGATFLTGATHPDELIREYEKELLRRGRSKKHAAQTAFRLRHLLEGVLRFEEVTSEFARRALQRVAEHDGLSGKTVNDYRVSLSGLCTWLEREGRWAKNPVKVVARVEHSEPTRVRRALTEKELLILLERVPPVRSAIYRLAATTGLRRSEIGSLVWSDVDLDAATVVIRARAAKNRRDAVLPLAEGTVDALRALRPKEPKPDEKVFESIPLIRTFYKDLKRSGLQKTKNFEGVDFHALRATFATLLAVNDVTLTQAQRLLRHSDPKLTANVYTKLRLEDAHAAVAKIDPGRRTKTSGFRAKAGKTAIRNAGPAPSEENGGLQLGSERSVLGAPEAATPKHAPAADEKNSGLQPTAT